MGASQPIGRAAALALAEAGADVVVTTTLHSQGEEEAVRACAQAIRALQRNGFAQTLDITSEVAVAGVVERTIAELGHLDILVNAHDLPFAKPFPQVSLREWRRVLEVNLTGTYLACRAVAEPMLARGKGRIINIVSLLGERGMANGSAYCAAQAGVLNLTRALALEWARNGITVNAIGAGWTEGMGLIANKELQRQLARYLPSRRLAQPREIAEAAVYLASDAAAFLTGQVMWIEGGALSHL
jgi:NAD(P)-dependent dehydrogenase (short-subunit alcohol dehydrogenase family)